MSTIRRATLVTALALLCVAAVATAGSIKTRCTAKWPGDYQMQEFCVDLQYESYRKVSAWNREHIPDYDDEYRLSEAEDREPDYAELILGLLQRGHRATLIVVSCTSKWDYDWHMSWFCVEQQEKSLGRLGKSLDEYDPVEARRMGY